PFTVYHLAETLQLLGFAALGFFLLKNMITPKDTISVDVDWLYRKLGDVIMRLIRYPIQHVDTAWGEAYRVVGLYSLMKVSRFWAWFDWHGIDGIVDGFARSVRALGGKVRVLQSGQIQYVLFYASTLAAVVLITFILYQLF
ncbi:MAG: Na(+)/H(+) antiporter subunit D, partial [Desulfobacterales bacterium]